MLLVKSLKNNIWSFALKHSDVLVAQIATKPTQTRGLADKVQKLCLREWLSLQLAVSPIGDLDTNAAHFDYGGSSAVEKASSGRVAAGVKATGDGIGLKTGSIGDVPCRKGMSLSQ